MPCYYKITDISAKIVTVTNGEVQEWLNWPLSKSGMAQAIEGSNPSLSARREATSLYGWSFLF